MAILTVPPKVKSPAVIAALPAVTVSQVPAVKVVVVVNDPGVVIADGRVKVMAPE